LGFSNFVPTGLGTRLLLLTGAMLCVQVKTLGILEMFRIFAFLKVDCVEENMLQQDDLILLLQKFTNTSMVEVIFNYGRSCEPMLLGQSQQL
jgi:hypothetical protein